MLISGGMRSSSLAKTHWRPGQVVRIPLACAGKAPWVSVVNAYGMNLQFAVQPALIVLVGDLVLVF